VIDRSLPSLGLLDLAYEVTRNPKRGSLKVPNRNSQLSLRPFPLDPFALPNYKSLSETFNTPAQSKRTFTSCLYRVRLFNPSLQ
jgi:hypothetical protein